MDENKNEVVNFTEFVRAIRPIYCYKNYSKAVPEKKDMSPTKIYHRPRHEGGISNADMKSSRAGNRSIAGGSRRNIGNSESRRLLTTTEYDASTGRPVGKKLILDK